LALSVRCKPKIEFHLTDPFSQHLNPAAGEPNAASGTLRLAKRSGGHSEEAGGVGRSQLESYSLLGTWLIVYTWIKSRIV